MHIKGESNFNVNSPRINSRLNYTGFSFSFLFYNFASCVFSRNKNKHDSFNFSQKMKNYRFYLLILRYKWTISFSLTMTFILRQMCSVSQICKSFHPKVFKLLKIRKIYQVLTIHSKTRRPRNY